MQAAAGIAPRPSFSGLLSALGDDYDPVSVFHKIRSKIVVDDVEIEDLASTTPHNPENTVRLVCVSDTHSAHGVLRMPPGDILVHAGDFTNVGSKEDIESFCTWLKAQPYKHKVVIAGNHDISLEADFYARSYRRFGHRQQADTEALRRVLHDSCTFLEHEGAVIEGLKFFGSPYQPEFCDWAFNLGRRQCRAMWDTLPKEPVDVLLTHGPPLAHGDECDGNGPQGCIELLDYVTAFPPKFHIFGHIHESFGATTNGKTTFINASTLNLRYDTSRPRPPVVIDVPRPKAAAAAAAAGSSSPDAVAE